MHGSCSNRGTFIAEKLFAFNRKSVSGMNETRIVLAKVAREGSSKGFCPDLLRQSYNGNGKTSSAIQPAGNVTFKLSLFEARY
jgi:hypothetical protein